MMKLILSHIRNTKRHTVRKGLFVKNWKIALVNFSTKTLFTAFGLWPEFEVQIAVSLSLNEVSMWHYMNDIDTSSVPFHVVFSVELLKCL